MLLESTRLSICTNVTKLLLLKVRSNIPVFTTSSIREDWSLLLPMNGVFLVAGASWAAPASLATDYLWSITPYSTSIKEYSTCLNTLISIM